MHATRNIGPGVDFDVATSVVSDEVLQRLSDPLHQVRGLPNEVFTSEAFMRLEQNSLFPRSWVFAGRASHVGTAGDRIPIDVVGHPLFMIKDASGRVRVFHNVCPHRGARIVPSCGHAASVVCPYHAWTFDFDGVLRGRPHFHGPGDNDVDGEQGVEAPRLFEVRTATWADWVFVNLDGTAPEFESYAAALFREWTDYDLSDIVHAHHLTVDYGCNWKLALENYADFYHVFKVHPVLDASLSPEQRRSTLCEGAVMHNETWTHERYATLSVMEGAPSLPDMEGPTANGRRRTVFAVLFPNCAINIHHSDVQFSYFEPLSTSATRLHRHFYFRGEAATDPQFETVRDQIFADWEVVLREDEGVCALVQQGRGSPAYDGGRFAPGWDEGTRHFHQLVARAVTG